MLGGLAVTAGMVAVTTPTRKAGENTYTQTTDSITGDITGH